MSDSAQREWRFYLDDMIGFTEKVIAYTDGLDQAGFVANSLKYDATMRNLELTGDAATHIPDAVRAANPQIPWRLSIARIAQAMAGNAFKPSSVLEKASLVPSVEERPSRPARSTLR
jgi:uncharacterized protein with HEPN domain